MSRSKRKTSKLWLGVTLIVSFVALFLSLWRGLETAAVGITVMIPAVYGAYVGVGHMDFRQAISNFPGGPPDI
ncbi:hypothetical protein CN074_25095 [Sinorhizobium medicae]|uniref:hypothetical protein n=1 Tax=Sinorhizobium medicae TaxID=110321 RepID=UPI000FD6CE58|nr:hypothetical protein [Sinorhizobium medicae]RVH83229.1 hypothetical protein CN201_28190 [Sinorhizobium medicae]RVP63874.1 hypothetical protein CN074_25095 [Sinorhizobium medicae]